MKQGINVHKMGKVLVISEPKTILFESYEDTELAPQTVLLRALYSGISAGTELTASRGTNVYI